MLTLPADSARLEELLRQGFGELELEADELALDRLGRYYALLDRESRVMNLTAIHGAEDTARLHFLDCAVLLKLTELRGKRLVDVGTGAGFPGLVLKILVPDLELVLLDSLDKRVRFLELVCRELELEGVRCLHARAEEAPAELRQSFDVACSRAVARLNLLGELCLPLVKKGGLFVAMKGPDAAGELSEARKGLRLLGGGEPEIREYPVPGTELRHNAILVPKTGDTPARYPRRWAQIKKQPL